MNDDEDDRYLGRFEELISKDKHRVLLPQLLAILHSPREPNAPFSVFLDAKLLLDSDPELGHCMLREPLKMLDLFSKALVAHQAKLCPPQCTVKPIVHARVNWLPSVHRKANISSIRSHDVGSFVQFSGTVVRSGMLQVLEAKRVFLCGNQKCNQPIVIDAKQQQQQHQGGQSHQPTGSCPHCRKSSTYTENTDLKVCHDYQEIRVQEHVQKLGMGSIPRAITVVLTYDLVDACKAGDDVIVTGVPVNRWGAMQKDERLILETIITGNTVHVGNAATVAIASSTREEILRDWSEMWARTPHCRLRQRDDIVSLVCPQLFGLYMVKLAVLLTIIGSPAAFDSKTKMRVRGDPHLLLVGDPGTGKSQFLRFAKMLSPRSVLTTGVGTTQAGLTCSTIKEGSEFVLEAGALVLADNGLCCIDEFSSLREHDRACIHEALEQQSLSVAKAGLVTKLNTRTSVLAATNPVGNYDVDATISANTNIAPPLLSRFDLIIVLLDCPDVGWDRVVSETLLQSHMMTTADEDGSPSKRARRQDNPIMSFEQLRAYIAHVKTISPELTEAAGRVLTTYYSFHRRNEQEAGRTTLRFLESLIRLSKAHARLMYRSTVLVGDALVAISLMELSISSSGGKEVATLHIDFPPDPDEYFAKQVAPDILRRLDLDLSVSELFATA